MSLIKIDRGYFLKKPEQGSSGTSDSKETDTVVEHLGILREFLELMKILSELYDLEKINSEQFNLLSLLILSFKDALSQTPNRENTINLRSRLEAISIEVNSLNSPQTDRDESEPTKSAEECSDGSEGLDSDSPSDEQSQYRFKEFKVAEKTVRDNWNSLDDPQKAEASAHISHYATAILRGQLGNALIALALLLKLIQKLGLSESSSDMNPENPVEYSDFEIIEDTETAQPAESVFASADSLISNLSGQNDNSNSRGRSDGLGVRKDDLPDSDDGESAESEKETIQSSEEKEYFD